MDLRDPELEATVAGLQDQPDGLRLLSLTYGEFVPPDREIVVEVEGGGIDAEAALHTVQVVGVPGTCDLEGANRLVWLPEQPLAEGSYTFRIDELRSVDGEVLIETLEVPFYVYESRAEVPEHFAVVGFARLVIDDLDVVRIPLGSRPQADYIELLKAIDRESGQAQEFAFDAAGQRLEVEAVHGDLDARWTERYGKLHPALADRLAGISQDRPVDVALWLIHDETPLDEVKFREDASERIPREVEMRWADIRRLTGAFIATMAERFPGRRFEADAYAPVVFATLAKHQVTEISHDAAVAAVFPDDRNVTLHVRQSLQASQWFAIEHYLGSMGQDVDVAVWEDRPDDTAALDLTSVRDAHATPSQHARLVSAIIKNRQRGAPKGYAPFCRLHIANPTDYRSLNWALATQRCTVVNQSWNFAANVLRPYAGLEDVYIDRAAVNWPFPTIIRAAGNDGTRRSHCVAPKSFNTLVVGNHNDAADAMAPSSSYSNPRSAHGDRELPELCANGTEVSSVGLRLSGTSLAAPAVAGTAAVLQSTQPKLKNWPEGCRAILLAGTARKPTLGTWEHGISAGLDQADGAGTLNVDRSVRIALAGETPPGISGAKRRGWDVGRLDRHHFDDNGLSKLSYQILAAREDVVQVALAWNRPIDPSDVLRRRGGLDLDLWVYDWQGRLVARSSSWDNSYEMVGFRSHRAMIYTIRIRHFGGQFPTWYGIAWISEASPMLP